MKRWTDLPAQVTLKPSRLKWALIMAVGLAFVAIAIWVPAEGDKWWRWFVGGFFGLVALVALPGVIGIGARLELGRDSFTCVTLFRTWKRRWDDCSVFEPIAVGPNRFVGFSTLSDEHAHPGWSNLNRAVAGTSGMLPDTYGLGAARLAELMNRFRARALKLPDPA